MDNPADRVANLLAEFDAADACPAALLCDRHPAGDVAFTVVEPDMTATDLTYGWLRSRSEQAAAAFARSGVVPGDRVATLMGKGVDLVVAVLGIWRLGAVHVPLFTAFAPDAVAVRLGASDAKLVVCASEQRDKVHDTEANVLVSGTQGEGDEASEEDAAFAEALDAEQPGFPAAITGGRAPMILLFTSGTTGEPKGVPVPVRALAAFQTYLEYGLEVRHDDVFWNAADPGWAYGLYYGIVAPLAAGRRSVLLRAGFTPEMTWRLLTTHRITNFAAAPTIYRALRSSAPPAAAALSLRVCSSAGEPLNPEVVSWAREALGVAVHDHYGQTELGMAIVNGWHPDVYRPPRRGSMGRALPGWSAEVLLDDRDEPAPVGTPGRVVIDLAGSPLLWFGEYWRSPERTAERYSPDGRWYYTGDSGAKDENGCFFFSARDDDVIIMAGYRIGPFEVESALLSHPGVVEAAAIGTPDELRGEVVEAFVVLAESFEGTDELAEELKQHVKDHYAAHAYPRRVQFAAELPKTASGKIQRVTLRQTREAQLSPP